MYRRLLLIILAGLTLAACSKSQPAGDIITSGPNINEGKRIASVDVVRVAVTPTEIPAGGEADVTVHLAIQAGYHVNANPPTFPYLIPTELALTPDNGISAGSTVYPKALSRKFGFEEKPLNVYEGEFDLKVPVKAESSAAKGERSVPAKLRIQACDEEVCYPPGTLEVTIPLRIK